MDFLLKLLKPLFLPLLKLDFRAPHLPEGSSLVRSLKPSDRWLAYKYLQTLLRFLQPFIFTGIAVIPLIQKSRGWALVFAVVAFGLELLSVAFALVTARVDFELRHYLVGDRSLRVVQGAWTREEVTLSYANVQNIEVTQGPLERLFGFKSITISTAGASDTTPGAENSHLVTLVGLDQADEVRHLILGMLKQQRDTGLGDHVAPASPATGLSLERLREIKAVALTLRDVAVARFR
ncbi:MAG: PH domain-containing protein [Myxococcaceae bacterium]